MTDIVVGVRLTADGSGLVGQLRLSRAELEQLRTAEKGAAEGARELAGATGSAAGGARDLATQSGALADAAARTAVAERQVVEEVRQSIAAMGGATAGARGLAAQMGSLATGARDARREGRLRAGLAFCPCRGSELQK
ncbi:MAG: hypothetical protein WCY29_07255, partial [Novosphingobium sp.]